jgi:hypothetical protein
VIPISLKPSSLIFLLLRRSAHSLVEEPLGGKVGQIFAKKYSYASLASVVD